MNSEIQWTGPEKRSERRLTAEGDVVCRLGGSSVPWFLARLIDVSPHGFRAAHEMATLSVGTELDFEHPGRSGKAVVIWNHIDEAGVQSGFLVKEARGLRPPG